MSARLFAGEGTQARTFVALEGLTHQKARTNIALLHPCSETSPTGPTFTRVSSWCFPSQAWVEYRSTKNIALLGVAGKKTQQGRTEHKKARRAGSHEERHGTRKHRHTQRKEPTSVLRQCRGRAEVQPRRLRRGLTKRSFLGTRVFFLHLHLTSSCASSNLRLFSFLAHPRAA